MTTDEITSLFRYFIVAGLFLDVLSLIVFVFHTVLRRSVMLRKRGVFYFLFPSLFIVLCGVLSVLAYRSDELTIFFGLSLLVIGVTAHISVIWNAVRLNSMQERVLELLEVLVGVIEAGDQNLDGHSLHVKELSMLMYEALPLGRRLTLNPYNLQYAALLLDIGKLGIPRSIIDKAGKLEDSEWQLVRRHPEIGTKVLEAVPSFEPILPWIQFHHERVDGSGYYHLTRNEIPLASRILAVADTYSAITMSRSYKASLPYEEAVGELKLVSGTQLDSDIVGLFCSIPMARLDSILSSVREKMERYKAGEFRNYK